MPAAKSPVAKSPARKLAVKPKPAARRPAPRARPAGTSVINPASLPGPHNIVRRQLPNGIVVLVLENHTSPSVVIDADLHVGALWESRAQAGLSNFTALALMRGTEARAFGEIYEAIESVGASLSFGGGTHTSGLYAKGLAEDLGLLLQLGGEALRSPTFPPDQVERLRSELLTRLAIRANHTHARAEEAFFELAYPGHPYAISEDGYPDTITALTRDELAAFHRLHYGPRGMVVTIVGAVRAEEAIDRVAATLGDWTNPRQPPEPPLPPLQPLEGANVRRVTLPGKIQSDIVLGGPGPARKHPDYLAARLANNILGVFGMGGRINEVVRQKHGMAYYAAVALDGGLGPGAWRAYAGVNPKNVDRAVQLMLAEVRKFTTRKVSADELEENKAFFLGRLPFSLETNEGLAGTVGSLELYDLGLDYLQRYPSLVNAITAEQVLGVARAHLSPERYALAIAGPGPA